MPSTAHATAAAVAAASSTSTTLLDPHYASSLSPASTTASSSAASSSASSVSDDPHHLHHHHHHHLRRKSGNNSSRSSGQRHPSPSHQRHHSHHSLQRPKLGSRKSSGTIIVPREHPRLELKEGDEVFDEDDARAMSPRRSSKDLESFRQATREELQEHAKNLQESLLEIYNRIEAVKEEHDKLDNNNKFLQKYIGDLMSTSKITATGGSRKR